MSPYTCSQEPVYGRTYVRLIRRNPRSVVVIRRILPHRLGPPGRDIVAATADEEEGQALIDRGESIRLAARTRRVALERTRATILAYAIGEEGKPVATDRPITDPGELANATGPQAVDRILELFPGQQMKVAAIYDEMVKLGYAGSVNSVQVVLSNRAEEGQIHRVRKGHYLLGRPDTEEPT